MDATTLTEIGAQFGFAGLVAALLLFFTLKDLRETLRAMVTLQRQMLVTLVRMCERLNVPEHEQPRVEANGD